MFENFLNCELYRNNPSVPVLYVRSFIISYNLTVWNGFHLLGSRVVLASKTCKLAVVFS